MSLSWTVRSGKGRLKDASPLGFRDVLQFPWKGGQPDPSGIVAIKIRMDPDVESSHLKVLCLFLSQLLLGPRGRRWSPGGQ